MKTIILASVISLIVIVGGYVFYLRQIMKQAPPTEVVETYTPDDIEAIEFAADAIENKKRELITLKADAAASRGHFEMAKTALATEHDRLADLLGQLDTRRDEIVTGQSQALDRLAKMYEMMKAKEAAEIAEKLSVDLLVEILPRMKDRSAAKLIASISTTKAVAVTQRLGVAQR